LFIYESASSDLTINFDEPLLRDFVFGREEVDRASIMEAERREGEEEEEEETEEEGGETLEVGGILILVLLIASRVGVVAEI
jgi:hypothetical protein